MAKIKVNDIKPAGAELFDSSESFMNELKNDELEQAMGGIAVSPPPGITLTPYSPLCPIFPVNTNPNHYPGPWTPVIL